MEPNFFDEMGSACKFFIDIGNCNDGKDGNKKILGATTREWEEYFKFLWMRAENMKLINIALNTKNPNVFFAVVMHSVERKNNIS